MGIPPTVKINRVYVTRLDDALAVYNTACGNNDHDEESSAARNLVLAVQMAHMERNRMIEAYELLRRNEIL